MNKFTSVPAGSIPVAQLPPPPKPTPTFAVVVAATMSRLIVASLDGAISMLAMGILHHSVNGAIPAIGFIPAAASTFALANIFAYASGRKS